MLTIIPASYFAKSAIVVILSPDSQNIHFVGKNAIQNLGIATQIK